MKSTKKTNQTTKKIYDQKIKEIENILDILHQRTIQYQDKIKELEEKETELDELVGKAEDETKAYKILDEMDLLREKIAECEHALDAIDEMETLLANLYGDYTEAINK